jgi:prepilin-type processing-associated H-X9-DG protein
VNRHPAHLETLPRDTGFQPELTTSDSATDDRLPISSRPHGREALLTINRPAFSLVELFVVIGIISMLTAFLLPTLYRARQQSQQAVCASNIRQLALANMLYAADNHTFCVLASSDIFDDLGDGEGGYYRWEGTRSGPGQPFNAATGPLAPYLGTTGAVRNCPVFDPSIGAVTGNNFEAGCGGYGYNEVYIGGRMDLYSFEEPQNLEYTTAAKLGQITRPSETVMFTDAGIAQPVNGIAFVTEYSFCEPPFVQNGPGAPTTYMATPSIHFRHRGRANVAWADGHVSAEAMTFSNGSYGLSPARVTAAGVGWFGPKSNYLFQITK